MRVSEHRVLVIAMVLLMVAVIGWFEGFLPSATPSVDSFCRGVSNPRQNVVLCEDFEDDAVNTRWDIGSNRRSEEHTSELQSRLHLVCRLLLEKKKKMQQIL